MRPWLLVASVLLFTPGCVYYNGVYNAKAAAKSAELRLQQGGEGEATTLFQQSAATAESVLVRFPTSTWRTRALYLAGRGGALGGQCETAVGRLTEFLAAPVIESGDRDRARIALAACDLRSGKVANARLRLDSIVGAPDASIAQGIAYDETMGDDIRVTVVATGLGRTRKTVQLVQTQALRTGTHDEVMMGGMSHANGHSHSHGHGHAGGATDGLKSPAVWRNKSASETVRALEKNGMETYDIPAFLRKQAD